MPYVTFLDKKRLGGGPLPVAKYHAVMNPGALIFGPDGKVVDIDPADALWAGSRATDLDPMKLPGTTVLYDARNPESRGPGRPKLGVTAREVTLLPRHWEWLAAQPAVTGAGWALAALRRDALRDCAPRLATFQPIFP